MTTKEQVELKAKELWYVYQSQELSTISFEDMTQEGKFIWGLLAKHVLTWEIKARIDELEELGAFTYSDRIKLWRDELKELESL